ncbi:MULTISPECIES: AfsA-related hotdog domain-containing protein [Actinokineospora]|uniref:A-factor biosynthesis protein AfsA n=1 Tax=Actinokineospora fastidiosa TaxID=1816 RepID=A0A918LA31_9PSEU|nr:MULTISPECIES: AfsA-related hotdog domain-containing protein [Actinokineospora]UVS81990.1 A-factor biosynthesis hotdog domain protein [Actinokineospora sp. UTMC 2448]GGS24323.1 A-factor biosynthesis protein AfsA [Actinokineospora fastidiosa]
MDVQHRPTIHLVGERFSAFAANDGVATVNRFIGNIRGGLYDDLPHPVRLGAGQGVDASDWEVVAAELARRGLLSGFHLPAVPVVVPADLVHKRSQENVMLADARRRGPSRLAARLNLSDMNELVLDHVTGQHVAGMVLIEAARQLMHLANHELVVDGDAHSFVLCSLAAGFEGYVFPLGVDLECALTRLDTSKPARQDYSAEVLISQGGQTRARVRAEYQIVRTRSLTRQEAMLAAKAAASAEPDVPPRVCAAPVALRGERVPTTAS